MPNPVRPGFALPRRAMGALMATVAALVVLVRFDAGTRPDGAAQATTGESSTTATADPTAGTTADPAAGTTPVPTDRAATTTDGSATVTVAGDAVRTRYGTVQVQITVSDGTIVDVAAVSLPSGGRDGQISAYVEPILRDEALTAQSARIDAVSGATYTSGGYIQSLQSAIDRAGL